MKKYVLILGILASFNAQANEGWKNCDDEGSSNCEYQIKDGVLTVRPQDDTQPANIPDFARDCSMTRYSECTTTAPWKWDENTNTITTLKVENGITSIGSDAFEDMPFTTAHLPDTLTSIGSFAFLESGKLGYINLPNKLETIGDYAFTSNFSSQNNNIVIIPDSVNEVGKYVFSGGTERIVVGGNTNLDPDALIYYGQTSTKIQFNHFTMYCAESNTSCQEAIEKALNFAKNAGNADVSAQASDFLTTYTKDDNGFYQIGDKLYATADLMTKGAACDNPQNCRDILDAASQGKPFEVGGKYYATLDLFARGAACTDKQNCEDILASNGAPFKVGSKIYNSMEDFALGNNIKFRIYTIDEANEVAGKTNSFKIRYR